MPRYIAFLRAINVGGHVVKMENLRALFESLQFKNVETFIASGNVIFETRANEPAKIEAKIEERLHKSLGYEVATFLRTDSELSAIAQYRPFSDAAIESAATFCVGFMKAPLSGESKRKALAFKTEIEDFHLHGAELYWISRMGQSDSAFSNALLEKALGIRSTFRSTTTVRKLAAKYPPTGSATAPQNS